MKGVLLSLLAVHLCLTVHKTSAAATCAQGPAGIPGNNGVPGNNGLPGVPGRDGRDGNAKGTKGDHGLRGPKGHPGNGVGSGLLNRNWKQCAWKSDEGKDNGLIKECIFRKKEAGTSLRVFYEGNLRITGCTGCCRRWYLTFNGAECSGPIPIEGVFYMILKGQDMHRHRHIEGYCDNIPKGTVRIGFWVGNCVGYAGNVNAHTGWNSGSRIVVEEVPPQQS